MDFLKRSLVLRLTGAYGVVFAVGLLIVSAFCFTRVSQLIDETIDAYGNTVAAQLAHSSLDAVMQRDQIALQAQLARLLKAPAIVSAGIYDASSVLLAQAGATPSELAEQSYLHNYSASLGLGDNMSGSVVVTLRTEKIERLMPQIRWVLAAMLALEVVLLLLLSRYFSRHIREQETSLIAALIDTVPPAVLASFCQGRPEKLDDHGIRQVLVQLQEYVRRVQAPSPAALRDAAADLLNNSGGRAYLLLECHNLDLLQRQVSRDRLRAVLDRFQTCVEKTARLYNAQRMPASGSCMKLVMLADNEKLSEVLLRAACCAQVLVGVLAQCRDEELGIQLQWSLALDWHEPCDNDILRNSQQAFDEQRSQWLCRQVGSGQLAVSADAGALLQEQDKLILTVEHGEGGKPFYRINGFVQTQRMLLDGQIAQLLEDKRANLLEDLSVS
ncbi:MAG: hypothetical protein IT470_06220 [Pseudomonadales bacterium]|nr:hypothetical protein [Pseudomonadales bacterium]